jgi:hypothetical protein
MHVGVIAFFICKPNCGSIRGLFKRIPTCNVILVGDAMISGQSKKGQKALAVSQETQQEEVSQNTHLCGIFVCMCIVALSDVGRCVHELKFS